MVRTCHIEDYHKEEDGKQSTCEDEEVALSNAVSLYIGKLKEESDIVPCFNTFYEFVETEYRKVLEEKKVREKDFDIDGFLNVLEKIRTKSEKQSLM